MKAAYLLDAVAWVQWIAWLEKKMSKGTDSSFTEWHAAEHLSRLRAGQPLFAGLAYENISATGANAGESLHRWKQGAVLTTGTQHCRIIQLAKARQLYLEQKMST
jgi:Xaa-Pro aminopeptidase